jgi:hypothetical protein
MRQILRQRGDTTGGPSGCRSQSGGGFAEKSAKLEPLKPSRPPLPGIAVRFVPYFAAAKVKQCYLHRPVTGQTGVNENKLACKERTWSPSKTNTLSRPTSH